MAEDELWDYDRLVDTSKLVISQTVGTRGGQRRGDVKSSVPNSLSIWRNEKHIYYLPVITM